MDARKGKRDKLIAKMRRRGDCAIITRLIHVPHPTAAHHAREIRRTQPLH